MAASREDITGKSFNKLFVVGRSTVKAGHWECRCECGNTRHYIRGAVEGGSLKSCGCGRESGRRVGYNRRHGHTAGGKWTPEYRAWVNMLNRYERPNHPDYGRYGGRGIRVCDRWRESAAASLEDMGPKPSRRHAIERIDPDGHYEPGNRRWATQKEQQNNRSTNRVIEWDGRRLTATQWSEATGIAAATIIARLNAKWPAERALTASVRRWPSTIKRQSN